jgi:hypothetical protein
LRDGGTSVSGGEEVIKEGELVWTEDVGIRLGLDAIPEFGNGGFEYSGRLGVHEAIFAFSSVF